MTELTPFDRKCIAAQVAYYKAHRRLFQFGTFYRVRTPEHDNRPVWLVVSEDRREAIACLFQFRAEPAHTQDILRLTGLDDALLYEIEGRAQYLSLRAFGSLVKHALPVKLNGEGVPMAMLATRYRFPMPEEQYLAGGDMLQKADSGCANSLAVQGTMTACASLGTTAHVCIIFMRWKKAQTAKAPFKGQN